MKQLLFLLVTLISLNLQAKINYCESNMTYTSGNYYVYDNAVRLVSLATSLDNNKTKIMISLSGLESGIYYVKCHNKTFNNYFKVVKL